MVFPRNRADSRIFNHLHILPMTTDHITKLEDELSLFQQELRHRRIDTKPLLAAYKKGIESDSVRVINNDLQTVGIARLEHAKDPTRPPNLITWHHRWLAPLNEQMTADVLRSFFYAHPNMSAVRASVADKSYSKEVLEQIGFTPVEESLQKKLMRQFINTIYDENTVHMEISREADRMAL